MPELPEVETVRRSLAPFLVGARILEVRFLSTLAAGGRPDALAAALVGRTIQAVSRTGKHLLLRLDSGLLDIHLRMTGKLLWNAEPGPHARAILTLDNGTLVFDDVRQFGRFVWRKEPPPVGPDALGIDAPAFIDVLRAHRGAIKPLLLRQDLLSGLGNIYVDEILFRAGIHPNARAARLSRPRLSRLYSEMKTVLGEAIGAGGSSISDYVDATGQRGSFQQRHRVYGKAGEPCPRCGAPIRRSVVSQRGTHFCPVCQKR
ncbi:MAG: bifunctional DNA-formamidopyrimidine glycosylase/DNA-(apurinic or apyrimidinic site) lyase [Bryobacterales bacterium]|nr:bifunctional DNA-formamidopyrimidine glycosylase/DNA-(apurinic or apyrimidinic site) lyase [Bryobacterales bacterium]